MYMYLVPVWFLALKTLKCAYKTEIIICSGLDIEV